MRNTFWIPKAGELYKLVSKKSVILNGYLISPGEEIKISSAGTNDGEPYFTFISPSLGLGSQTHASNLDCEHWEMVSTNLLKTQASAKKDMVNHPSHYANSWVKKKVGIEVIELTRHMDFDLGSAVKYILRQGEKQEEGYTKNEKAKEDLEKAIWYINDYIKHKL